MRHSAIAKAFGKSLRGGLLLYGPPGCGKTFLARAVAGELGARFMSVVMTDVLSSYIGQTEKTLRRSSIPLAPKRRRCSSLMRSTRWACAAAP